MASLVVQQIANSGTDVLYANASSGGDRFAASATTFLHVRNGSGSSIDVTVDSITPCDQGFEHDAVVAVPAGDEKMIGPFDTRFWASDNTIGVTYSAVTSVTVAALKL